METLLGGDASRVLDEVQIALYELASARDCAEDGGAPGQVHSRRDDALARIRGAMEGLCISAQKLLCALGEAEEGALDTLGCIAREARAMWALVEPRGPLDLLLDQLDAFRDLSGPAGEMELRSSRADLLDVRAHLHQVYSNFERIAGRPCAQLS